MPPPSMLSANAVKSLTPATIAPGNLDAARSSTRIPQDLARSRATSWYSTSSGTSKMAASRNEPASWESRPVSCKTATSAPCLVASIEIRPGSDHRPLPMVTEIWFHKWSSKDNFSISVSGHFSSSISARATIRAAAPHDCSWLCLRAYCIRENLSQDGEWPNAQVGRKQWPCVLVCSRSRPLGRMIDDKQSATRSVCHLACS